MKKAQRGDPRISPQIITTAYSLPLPLAQARHSEKSREVCAVLELEKN